MTFCKTPSISQTSLNPSFYTVFWHSGCGSLLVRGSVLASERFAAGREHYGPQEDSGSVIAGLFGAHPVCEGGSLLSISPGQQPQQGLSVCGLW